MAKTTQVTLMRQFDGQATEFEVSHAERILMMPNSGWQLPANSEYEYKNGYIVKRDKGKDK
jgi:hypothetical protein